MSKRAFVWIMLSGLVLATGATVFVRSRVSASSNDVRINAAATPRATKDGLAAEIQRATAALREGRVPLALDPGGEQLLFQEQGDDGYRLVVRGIDGRELRRLVTGARPRLTTFSPSGRYVSYAADSGAGEYQLTLWDLNYGRRLTPEVPRTNIVTQPRWSRDSRSLTHVVERRDGPRDLYVVIVEGGGRPEPWVRGITVKAGVAWAPSGASLATVRAEAPKAISVVEADGREQRFELAHVEELRDLAFSHNGRALLFTERRTKEAALSLAELDLETRAVRRFESPASGDVAQPFYLPNDAGFILRMYPGDEKLVFSCERANGACQGRGPTRGQVTAWGASPAGERLYLGRLEPRSVLQVDLRTGVESVLFERPLPADLSGREFRVDVRSLDGLAIPLHYREGAKTPGMARAVFVQLMGAFGRESPAPWDVKTDYLHAAGVSVLKVHVRGKGGFGPALLNAKGGTAGRIEDALAALRYVREGLGVPPARTVLFGHSDGALLAAKVAATRVTIGKLVVSSMLRVDERSFPAQLLRCADAYQGSEDQLAPGLVPRELTALLGDGSTSAPCGSMTALPGEAHELEKPESWGRIYGSVVHFFRHSQVGTQASDSSAVQPRCDLWPRATGEEELKSTVAVVGSFDGRLRRFRGRAKLGTSGQQEEQWPLFRLEPGAVLKNVVIGSPAADGIHCQGACSLINVWWEDVGEDAATFRGASDAQRSVVRCGGARNATDKVFQHNGAGSLTIEDFFVDTFGKFYRSCGNCKTQYPRHVELRNVTAKRGGLLVALNENFGDTANFANIVVDGSVTVCERFEGNTKQAEPKLGKSGPDAEHCRYDAFALVRR